jgi:hypothetical protein
VVDQASYYKLALSVLLRAVKDVHEVGGTTPMQQSYFRRTARSFLSDHTNASLTLWCAWLEMDPMSVQEAYETILTRTRSEATDKDQPDD